MYSYNNIIDKGEPINKHLIDGVTISPMPIGEVKKSRVDNRVDVVLVENFLSNEECDEIISACEEVGYTFWQQKDANTRGEMDECSCNKSSRAFRVVDTIEASFPKLSQALSARIQKVVELEPKFFSSSMENAEELFARDLEGKWVPIELATNLLFGKYGPGGHFSPHVDGSTIVDLNTRSLYTLLIYLNDCKIGGETIIFTGEQADVLECDIKSGNFVGKRENRVGSVRPMKGSAVFFYCDVLHEGSPVGDGCCKYILRGDFLYRRDPPILTEERDQLAFELYEKARVEESNGNAILACEMFQKVRKLSRGVAELYQL
ncbi:Oxoglutarate/iron-dependent dioxygenase [Trypanosoma melophagium]|uniref:Oxoglutarate/iron-dependent dioxygenase n=1 Tax=Trypanosoma melophagium TaxID=715481 RepID=UPI00351A7FAF|nr:Oxoglutarate/iron-dependent dioxygenase [Trypanosoma melophagium]